MGLWRSARNRGFSQGSLSSLMGCRDVVPKGGSVREPQVPSKNDFALLLKSPITKRRKGALLAMTLPLPLPLPISWTTGLWTYGRLLGIWFPVNLALYGLCHCCLSLLASYREQKWERRLYILKNLSKSIILCFLVHHLYKDFCLMLFYDKWPPNESLYQLGTVYVVTDITGLLLVKLELRTKIHHYCVLVLGMYSVLSDYQQPGIHRALIYLTYLSMAAYLVNTYLALRFIISKQWQKIMATVAVTIYVCSIFLNFIIQHLSVWQALQEGGWSGYGACGTYMYVSLYWLILNDDIILLRFLYYHSCWVHDEAME